MSGFGIRAFKKHVEDVHKDEKDQYIRYVVYGQNTYAILTFLKLHKKFPGEVKLISESPFYKEDMLKEWNCSLTSVRSEAVSKALMSLNTHFEIYPSQKNVLFYKDTKFHKFGGRAKPFDLKDKEKFFTSTAYEISLKSMFDENDLETLDETLKANQLNKIISEIELLTPTDLVEKTNFKLHTGENESIRCEKLYFCHSPKKFLNLVENKNQLSDAVYAYAAGIHNEQAIMLHINFKGNLEAKGSTYLLPQSMTHEWGNFIVELADYDEKTNTQELKSLIFVGDDDLQEEDLAKKIKLFKRVLERVFPKASELDFTQEIKFSDEYLQSGKKDGHFEALKSQPVKFLGHASPIDHPESSKFEYLSRGLYAILSSGELQ